MIMYNILRIYRYRDIVRIYSISDIFKEVGYNHEYIQTYLKHMCICRSYTYSITFYRSNIVLT